MGNLEPIVLVAVAGAAAAATLVSIRAWTWRNALRRAARPGPVRREEELRSEESASDFELAAGRTSDLFFLVGPDGKVLHASPSVLRFWSVPLEGIRGHDFTEKMPEAERARAKALIAEAVEKGTARGTLHATLPDGELRSFDTILNRSSLGDRTAVAISGRDSTDQLRLAEQLQQLQKLETLGQLAGGVAHDFNNLLTVIRSGAALVREALPAGHPAHADLDEMVGAADRGSALTRQLLALVRREPAGSERADVARVLSGMARYIPRLLGKDMHLRVTADVSPGEVPVSATQLEQVVLNLVLNARDAMPDGGWIRISARGRQVVAGEPCGLEPGAFVEIAVQDEGKGFGDDVRQHLFEPFFTTKGAGKGSGLGLATARGIVTRAGGTIEASSTPGKGSTFRVVLPRLAAPEIRLPAEDAFARVRRSRVLVADHDPQLVALVTRLLAARGHEVVTAASAMEARQQAASYPGAVDVVVAGLELGESPGIEILGEVRRTSPVARAVLVTGDVRDPADLGHLQEVGVQVVHRPLSPDELVAVVERAAAQVPARGAPAMA